MTANFSINRVFQLVKKQWIENSRRYLYATLALIGLLGIVFSFWVFAVDRIYTEDSVYAIFLIGLFFSGAVFASVSFSALADKAKATYWLSIPASHLEKLLCNIFYCLFVFTAIYLTCFFIVKTVAMLYVQNLVSRYPDLYQFIPLRNKQEFSTVFYVLLYAYFGVQAFYLLGSVYFPKLSFVLTTAVGAALVLSFIAYFVPLLRSFFPESGEYHWNGLYVSQFVENGSQFAQRRYQLSPLLGNTLFFLIKYMWAPVFWVVAWYRLKEKQV